MAWALQLQGIPPAGIVSDSGVIDQDRTSAIPPACVADDQEDGSVRAAVGARVDPDVANPNNLPDLLVSRGELTVPIIHIWNHGDPNLCGQTPMTCALRDGSSPTLGVADCRHENLRRAIASQGPSSRSKNFPVCVTPSGAPPCAQHVVTTRKNGVNTDPASPADYQSAILAWVQARLADPAPG